MISDDREKIRYLQNVGVCLPVDAVASLFSDDRYRCLACELLCGYTTLAGNATKALTYFSDDRYRLEAVGVLSKNFNVNIKKVAALFSDDRYLAQICGILAKQHPCPPIAPLDAVDALAMFTDDRYRLEAAEELLRADVCFDIVAVSEQFSDDRYRVEFLSAAPPPSLIRQYDPPLGSPYPPYPPYPHPSLPYSPTIPAETHITSGMVFEDSAAVPVHPLYDKKDIQNIVSSIVVPQVPKESQCSICMERVSDSAAVPCGHVFCCDVCAKTMTKASPSLTCPICRQPITTIMKLFKV